MSLPTFGNNGYGYLTQSAGTVIQFLIPPNQQGKALLDDLNYSDGGSAVQHTITTLRSLGFTFANGVNAASQNILNIVKDPGPTGDGIAGNDYIALRTNDNITRLYQVSSVSSLALTLLSNLTVATNGNEKIWMLGQTGDTDPRSGQAHPQFKTDGTGNPNSWPTTNTSACVVGTYGLDEPILVNIDNITHQGHVNHLGWGYAAN